jgi:hypothetical protein
MSNSFGPDEAWITPSLAGQLGISHKNLEGEWANKYTRTDIHDTALARIAELEAALIAADRLYSASDCIDTGRSIHNERLPMGAAPLNGPAWTELRGAVHSYKTSRAALKAKP